MTLPVKFSSDVLRLDAAAEVERIARTLTRFLARQFKRRGVVVALSGGVDSSVVGALCVEALGPNRVFGLLLPERESATETRRLSRLIADHFGIEVLEQDITPILEAVGCYRLRNEAVLSVVPEYGPEHKCKIVLPTLVEEDRLRLFSVVVQAPDGGATETRLPHEAYLAVVAASNFKQRVRKMLEYYHADRLNYAVVGTPNRLEYDQGFFVKGGDGLADVKPIAHLYKTQVYQLAEYLGVPEVIRRQTPTTDTYPLAQTQEEFYFSLPFEKMDLCLFGHNHGVGAGEVGKAIGCRACEVERVFRDIEQKRRSTRYLHMPPQLVDPISEIDRSNSDRLMRP
jgi:NAD+ synthase